MLLALTLATYINSIQGAQYDHIKENEGFRSEIYKDSLGYDTIGYGHRWSSRDISRHLQLRGLQKYQADEIFREDISSAESIANRLRGYSSLTPDQKECVVEICFVLGNKVHTFKRFKSALLSNDIPEMKRELINSRWFIQCPNRVKNICARL